MTSRRVVSKGPLDIKPSRVIAWTVVLLLHCALATYISLPTKPLSPVAHLAGASVSALVAIRIGERREPPSPDASAPPAPPTQPIVHTVLPPKSKPAQPKVRIVARPADLAAAPLRRPDVTPREIASYRVTEMPEYPMDAYADGEQGWVVLIVLVNAAGEPEGISVSRSVSPALDQAAIAAVSKWRFEPALIHGRPTPGFIAVPIGLVRGSLRKGTTNALVDSKDSRTN